MKRRLALARGGGLSAGFILFAAVAALALAVAADGVRYLAGSESCFVAPPSDDNAGIGANSRAPRA